MEQISSIESRTRASFKRVKRDIDALKRQIAKLRERDEKLDHALSDYTRTGEFYERLKAIDDRFERLSDSFATADEFEKAVQRIVKETAQLSKRLDQMERSDLSPEVSSLRKELETLHRSVVEKPAFDAFADKAAARIEKLEDSTAAADRRLKALANIEDRVDKLSTLESDPKRLSAIEKSLKKLERFEPAEIDTRLEKLEKEREKTPLFDMHKRIQVLEQAHEKTPFDGIESRLSAVEKELGSLEQQGADVKRLDRLADRVDAIESSLVSGSKVRTLIDEALEPFVKVEELNSKIDEFNAALETVADSERLAQLESRLDSERHATNAEVTAVQSELDDLSKRIESITSSLDSERHSTNAEVSTLADDLNAISTRLEKLEQGAAGIDTKTLAESTARIDSLESELSDQVDALASRLTSVEKVASSEHVSPTDFDETSDRLAQFEASLADVRERMEELGSSDTKKFTERLAEIEAQNNAVLAELADVSDSGVNTRVIEDMAGDLAKAQQRIEELAEDVELYTKSATKGAEKVESVEHLQSEIEFLRNNVAMQDEIEALRAQLDTRPEPEGNRVTVLSEDLRKLFERQSELEKKVLSLETQNRQLRSKSEDPLWKESGTAKQPKKGKRNVQLEENVPLRGPKQTQEPAPKTEPVEASKNEDEEPKGRFGRFRKWMVDFFTEEVDDVDQKRKDELY